MGFDAAWFAKVAFYIVGALILGFAGSLFFGAKLLGPGDHVANSETRTIQRSETPAPSAVPSVPNPTTDEHPHADPKEPSGEQIAEQPASLPDVSTPAHPKEKQRNEPPRYQASRGELQKNADEELRLGQQERRRLRAERRSRLDDANASADQRRKKRRQVDGDEPFFPFRF